MTRADVICSTFQAPVCGWIMQRVIEQKQPEWLERECSEFGKWGGVVKASSVLDEAICWAETKEGHQFWKEICVRLRQQNR
jgi:hypothetical protein